MGEIQIALGVRVRVSLGSRFRCFRPLTLKTVRPAALPAPVEATSSAGDCALGQR